MAGVLGADGTIGRADSIDHNGTILAVGGHVIVNAQAFSGAGSVISADHDVRLQTSTFSGGGLYAGRNVGLYNEGSIDISHVSFHSAGTLVVESSDGNIVARGSSSGVKTIRAGELQFAAKGDINLTAVQLVSTGASELVPDVEGNVVLLAGGAILLDAATSSVNRGEQVRSASGPERTRIGTVMDPTGLFAIGDKYKYHNWETRWNETFHTVVGSEIRAPK